MAPLEDVRLYVSTHGVYLHGLQSGFWPVAWQQVSVMQLMGAGHVALAYGSENLMHEGDLAEMVFCGWALAVKPDDPTLRSGSWMPADFGDRCAAEGSALAEADSAART